MSDFFNRRSFLDFLTQNIPSSAGREEFVRVRLIREDDEVLAEPILGGSALLSTLVHADGFIEVPMDKVALEKGQILDVRLF
jgi:molybdopterin molybdotransferase